MENDSCGNAALLGTCSVRATQLHALPSGWPFKCSECCYTRAPFFSSHILTSRSFICSKYSIRIKVDILLPDNLFAAGNCDTFLHIFVSKQFRTKPERYTFFLIDDKCESLDFNASSLLLVQGSISRMYFVVDVSVVKFHHGYLKP